MTIESAIAPQTRLSTGCLELGQKGSVSDT